MSRDTVLRKAPCQHLRFQWWILYLSRWRPQSPIEYGKHLKDYYRNAILKTVPSKLICMIIPIATKFDLLSSHFLMVWVTLVVPVYIEGNPGFLTYVQFWLISFPDSLTKKTQQTPNLKVESVTRKSRHVVISKVFFHVKDLPRGAVSTGWASLLSAFRSCETGSIPPAGATRRAGKNTEKVL